MGRRQEGREGEKQMKEKYRWTITQLTVREINGGKIRSLGMKAVLKAQGHGVPIEAPSLHTHTHTLLFGLTCSRDGEHTMTS